MVCGDVMSLERSPKLHCDKKCLGRKDIMDVFTSHGPYLPNIGDTLPPSIDSKRKLLKTRKSRSLSDIVHLMTGVGICDGYFKYYNSI